MDLMDIITQYWYLIFGFISIIILLIYKNKKIELDYKTKSNIQIAIYIIVFLISIIYTQNTFFSEHIYFLLGFIIIIPILTIFINYLMSKHPVVLVESRVQGEMFYDMGELPDDSIKEKINTYSGIIVHIMDRNYYETLEYYGNPSSPFKNVGDSVKFCDYFHKRMIYCPENPFLQNINFTANQSIFITFKKIIPEIMRNNLILTDLVDYKIQFELNKMRDNFPHALIGTNKQYRNIGKPFPIEKSIDEKINELIIKQKALHDNAEKATDVKNEGNKNV